MGGTLYQLAHVFLDSTISDRIHILNVSRESLLQVVKIRVFRHSFVCKLHLSLKEPVKLVSCRLMQSIHALLQPVGVVVLGVKLTVQVSQDPVHAVGQALRASQDLARRHRWREGSKLLLKRCAHRWLRRQEFGAFVEYAAVVRSRLRKRELLLLEMHVVCGVLAL